MVKGCMLRLGYIGALNTGNYLKSKFQKSFKFLIHCILILLSHPKGSYDQMRDYQMNMLTALVLNKKYNFSHIVFHYMAENITTNVKTWRYPRFVQMLIDHAYPGIDRNIKDDLLEQAHMSNNTLKQLAKYHPEPDLVVENLSFIKDGNYVDPDPENHQNWRNQEEMKEESGRRRRLATPIAEQGEGSSSKPKKKQKKKVQTVLIDEPDEDVPTANVEKEQEVAGGEDIEINADLFTTDTNFVENVVQTVTSNIQKEKEKVIDDIEGDDVDKETTSSSSSSDDEVIDEVERERRVREEAEKEKLIRKRKRQEQQDAPYVPSPEHISESQSTPRGRKKAAGRKKAMPKIRISKRPQKIVQKKQPEVESQKPPTPSRDPTPPHEPKPPQSPIHQSPPRQPTPPQHSSPPRLPTPPNQPLPIPQSTPQQPFISSQDIFGTPPLSQIQHGSSSRGLQTPQDNLLDVGDFDFANTSQVLKLEKKMENVIAENKRLAAENKKAADREKLFVNRVQELEKKVEADQTKIDILKVRVSELEEEKNRHDAQNEYFKLKHKELNEAKRARDHEFYMLNKVVESMLGSSVE
ncbi:neurofilament medium polypeptide-like [Helianthus annuus]|uniref:neurofilament medium polypeptide-like n=1 Tax=Helianthus annuus TaxID=4232 RepID=UPI000B8F1859|nr:neurofilament medium polypeptide-like [Helianthus annuus]